MGCILAVLALVLPRVLMFFIWLLTDWFSVAFTTWVWPLLGFFFMPYTTLAYLAAMVNAGQVSGLWLALVVVAAIVDIAHWGGTRKIHRRRVVRV